MGASPQSALAIVGVPFAGDVQVEEDVRAMLQGALSVLEPAGCALVGGHTSEVSELCLGTCGTRGWCDDLLANPLEVCKQHPPFFHSSK